jgi:hypothetical protein
VSEPATTIAYVGRDGELICPQCQCHILTPAGYDVQAGEGECPVCRCRFTVTPFLAREANARQARRIP